ncbi:MAG: hemerythrin domain-containing protein [Bdellovibrionales bacterium]|jgi:hemerythrin superfamily protein|nr:hemerythrin domain-containing protein [Bdellovibrionales bacterium]
MLIYDAIKNDHRKIQPLVEELKQAGEKNEKRRACLLLEEIRDELVPHSRAEEIVFYGPLCSVESQNPAFCHGYQEHIDLESTLQDALARASKEGIDLTWQRTVDRFAKALLHHVTEEETAAFQAARETFSEAEARTMAEVFEALKPNVAKEGWKKSALDIVTKMMPAKYAATVRNLTATSITTNTGSQTSHHKTQSH